MMSIRGAHTRKYSVNLSGHWPYVLVRASVLRSQGIEIKASLGNRKYLKNLNGSLL